MKIEITSIKANSGDCVEITALVYWRGLPRPNYEQKETDEQYAARVVDIAKDINSYNNLHIGWAELKQETDIIKIPTVEEYDS